MKISVLKPVLPEEVTVRKYLQQMDKNHWYSNWGPLLQEFERRLGLVSGIPQKNILVINNATAALSVCLKAILEQQSRPRVLIPDFTFAATAGAVSAINFDLQIGRISPITYELDPDYFLEMHRRSEVNCAIPVALFGRPMDIQKWEDCSRLTNLPLVYDFAACFDEVLSGLAQNKVSRNPFVYSLHATKVFGIGEGAVIICEDQDLLQKIRAYCNFGFSGGRIAHVPGANFKLSEIHAAYGLASLDEWESKRSSWQRVQERYLSHSNRVRKSKLMVGMGDSWISSYTHLICEDPISADKMTSHLNSEGIETRQWWGLGITSHPAYQHLASIQGEREVFSRFIGLPCHTELTNSEIDFVIDQIERFEG